VALVLAGLMFLIGFTYFEAFSAFFAAILIIAGAGGLFFLIDKYLITGFETIEELKKGNSAVGLYVLGYCILIGCSIIGAFVVYR
jgi:uncharacterized membrane protein YjfL (UPF0719 family)